MFLIEEYYSGQCNGVPEGDCSADVEQAAARSSPGGLDRDRSRDARVDRRRPLRTLAEVVERAGAAAAAAAARFEDPRGPSTNLAASGPGARGPVRAGRPPRCSLAAPFFGLRDTPSRIALIPGISIVLSLLSGIAVLGVWRGPLTDTKAWVVVAVAVGARRGAAPRSEADPRRV